MNTTIEQGPAVPGGAYGEVWDRHVRLRTDRERMTLLLGSLKCVRERCREMGPLPDLSAGGKAILDATLARVRLDECIDAFARSIAFIDATTQAQAEADYQACHETADYRAGNDTWPDGSVS